MTVKEQFVRILKASPHLPFASIKLISVLVGIPILLAQFFDTITTLHKDSIATFTGFTPVQERTREERLEYFFKLNYSFQADGISYPVSVDKGFVSREAAELYFTHMGEYSEPITIWYNPKNPNEIEFEDPKSNWVIYLFSIVILMAFAYYFGWILLKYYELELSDS